LDPLSKHALWKFIEEQKPGRAILLTTHAMDEAERLCDKVCFQRIVGKFF
jgi:ABC-type multidrug transport system ATPase subunit